MIVQVSSDSSSLAMLATDVGPFIVPQSFKYFLCVFDQNDILLSKEFGSLLGKFESLGFAKSIAGHRQNAARFFHTIDSMFAVQVFNRYRTEEF